MARTDRPERGSRLASSARRLTLSTAAVVVGETAALIMLAPLEWRTGLYVGLPVWTAWTITAVVYAVAALAIATGRMLPGALSLVWISGVVGALHAAREQAIHDHAAAVTAALRSGLPAPTDGAGLDSVRAGTSIAVVSIVVAAMAAIWHLGRVAHTARTVAAQADAARRAAEVERTQQAERDRADAERRAVEDRMAAHRAHQIEVARIDSERAVRLAEVTAERERAAADRAAAERAARPPRAPRTQPANAARTPTARPPRAPGEHARTPDRAGPATGTETPDDLRVRREQRDRVRGQWIARTLAGRSTPHAAVARTLGVEQGAARAQVSRWRTELRRDHPDAAVGGDR